MSGAKVERLTVALGERSYEIAIGDKLIAAAGREIAALAPGRRAVIVTDAIVAKLHLAALERSFEEAGIQYSALVVPPGEESKSFAELEALIDRLLEGKVDRGTLLVALGGGVVGDLTGFAAAITLRGLDYVQVPTTLLAQVDSSVGGKTAIDSPRGKNLIGAFHQPRLVLADTGALATLPRRELLAGYAEVVKYGLIGDAPFFAWLEGHGLKMIEGDPALLQQAVLTSCRAKAAIVAADERESGQRALLNLGHTFGHALEAQLGYGGELLHGEAVAVGMVLAFELSARLGFAPAEDAARVRRHLAAVGLPTDGAVLAGRAWSPQSLIEHMTRDKKVRQGKIAFVLTRGIGRAFLCDEVRLEEVEALLAEELAA